MTYPLPVKTTCTSLPGLSTVTHYQLGILKLKFLKKILEVSPKHIINVDERFCTNWKMNFEIKDFEIMIPSVLLT